MLARPIPYPIYQGGGQTIDVPSRYWVGLNGRGYMLDTDHPDWGEQSIPLQRAQSDQSDAPGEHTLSPEGTWRRSVDSWHSGAGQRYLDFADEHVGETRRSRFWKSQGVDPWEHGRLSLLPEVDAKDLSFPGLIRTVVCGARLYVVNTDVLKFTADITPDTPTFTTVTTAGTAIADATSITADGHNVYVADGTDVYFTENDTTTYVTAMGSPSPATVIRYVKGRLMHANGAVWSEMTGTIGSFTLDSIYTHRNADFVWADFVGGPTHIYAAGFSGDKSLVYSSALKADATGLDAPIVAAELPDGEIVRALGYYLGFLLIGTDEGVRVAQISDDGSLTVGDLIETSPCHCFEGQGRFVWFGWNYETSCGLGRMDLRTFNGTAPAYATDLLAEDLGAQFFTASVVTFQGLRVFVAQIDDGAAVLYAETTTKVASGTIESGLIGFGLTEPKLALYLDTRHAAGAGSYQSALAVDEGTFANVGSEVTTLAAGGNRYSTTVSQQAGEQFEVRHTLTRDGDDTTSGPMLNRWTLKALPQPPRSSRIGLPILLHETLEIGGEVRPVDVAFEKQVLESLWQSGRVCVLQQGMSARSVVVEDYRWEPKRQLREPDWAEEGTFVAIAKVV